MSKFYEFTEEGPRQVRFIIDFQSGVRFYDRGKNRPAAHYRGPRDTAQPLLQLETYEEVKKILGVDTPLKQSAKDKPSITEYVEKWSTPSQTLIRESEASPEQRGVEHGHDIPRKLRAPAQPASVGEVLKEEFLEPLGCTEDELAKRMGAEPVIVRWLCNNQLRITAKIALSLANALGTSPEFWINLQLMNDMWLALNKGYKV